MFRPRFAHRGAVLAGALSALPNHVYRTLRVHVESDEQTQPGSHRRWPAAK